MFYQLLFLLLLPGEDGGGGSGGGPMTFDGGGSVPGGKLPLLPLGLLNCATELRWLTAFKLLRLLAAPTLSSS